VTIDAGLTAILCVGETKDEYEAKLNKAVCALQLSKVCGCVRERHTAFVCILCTYIYLYVYGGM